MLEIRELSGSDARGHVAALAEVLLDCVKGGASVSFMAALSQAEAEAFFHRVVDQVDRGERILLGAFIDGRLQGTVQVVTATPPNQPHRADIAKLLVSREARGKGVATALMEQAEQAGRRAGKTLLVLDTVTGEAAERLYLRLGWQKSGIIPNYAMFPNGTFCDTTIFWKRLETENAMPPDNLQRTLKHAQPEADQKLIHVGLVGDTYTILVSGADTAGRYCLIDMYVPPGGGPPPHRHDFEETFTLLEGEVDATFRGTKLTVRAGETLHIPANAPHQFHNASSQPARLLCICSANIQFSSVASDMMGVSGRRIIEAMIAGEDSPELLGMRIRGKLQRKAKQVRESLKGTFDDFHRSMLAALYRRYQFHTAEMERCESLIEQHMEPYAKQIELLKTIPGVERLAAWNMIAELGADMTIFPNADHCASWAGLVPGDNQSAGKKMGKRCRKGNRYLRAVMTQAAWAVSHCKKGYLRAFFYRVKSRSGWVTAIVALAHKMLVIAYSMLRTGTRYQERGENYFDVINPERTTRRLVKRLQELGLDVQLSPRPRLELSSGQAVT